MKGYPPYLATAFDVNVALGIDKPRTQGILRKWIDAHEGWYSTEKLDSRDDGITDDTHRVVEEGGEDGEPVEYYQQVYGPLPGNALERRGITLEKAKQMAGLA